MFVDNNYANFETRLATSSCINLKRTSRRMQCHIEQSFCQVLDITEVCNFPLCFGQVLDITEVCTFPLSFGKALDITEVCIFPLSFGQVLDITEVCNFSLCFRFINSLYFYALTGRNLTENRDTRKVQRFVHKRINNFLIKQRRPVQNRVDFRRMELYLKCICKLDRFVSLQEERETSPRLALLPISTKPSLKERLLLFMVRSSRDISAPLTERNRETLGWNVRRNCNYGQTRTSPWKLLWNFQLH